MRSRLLAFVFGHISPFIYLPGWLINILLMFLAVRALGSGQKKSVRRLAWPLIMSWAFVSVFAGMGPPPPTAEKWAALALEQQARYCILIVSVIMTVVGLIRLEDLLNGTSGSVYGRIGKLMILIALPLFIANMIYWGFFLTNVFIEYTQPGAPAKPAWLQTVSNICTIVRMIEVTLIYLATAAFAHALSRSGHLSRVCCTIYIVFCFLAVLLDLLPENLPEPFATANYVSYIPAITLLMQYLLGVNLLRKSGK